MRAPLIRLSCLLSLLIASTASAVTMDWTAIGNPGNAADNTGYGAVGYVYSIGTYEVSNVQYAEFLNAKAKSDSLGLYDFSMISSYGGITRSGSSGSYTYSLVAGRENWPVTYISFYDALRFANWMHNGQGNGDTETGAYTLLGGTATPSNGTTVTRNVGATIVLPSDSEWYKAAYYDAVSMSYFDYPAGSNTKTICDFPTAAVNRANCTDSTGSAVGNPTIKGSYTGSASPYGTFDQGGNVWEWTERSSGSGSYRIVRGGSYANGSFELGVQSPRPDPPFNNSATNGFRVAMIPEPGTGLLVVAGLLGLTGWRWARA